MTETRTLVRYGSRELTERVIVELDENGCVKIPFDDYSSLMLEIGFMEEES